MEEMPSVVPVWLVSSRRRKPILTDLIAICPVVSAKSKSWQPWANLRSCFGQSSHISSCASIAPHQIIDFQSSKGQSSVAVPQKIKHRIAI